MTSTRLNSTNIDWASYEFDGWCPGCDFCRVCGHAHRVGTRHLRCDKRKALTWSEGSDPCKDMERLLEHLNHDPWGVSVFGSARGGGKTAVLDAAVKNAKKMGAVCWFLAPGPGTVMVTEGEYRQIAQADEESEAHIAASTCPNCRGVDGAIDCSTCKRP